MSHSRVHPKVFLFLAPLSRSSMEREEERPWGRAWSHSRASWLRVTYVPLCHYDGEQNYYFVHVILTRRIKRYCGILRKGLWGSYNSNVNQRTSTTLAATLLDLQMKRVTCSVTVHTQTDRLRTVPQSISLTNLTVLSFQVMVWLTCIRHRGFVLSVGCYVPVSTIWVARITTVYH